VRVRLPLPPLTPIVRLYQTSPSGFFSFFIARVWMPSSPHTRSISYELFLSARRTAVHFRGCRHGKGRSRRSLRSPPPPDGLLSIRISLSKFLFLHTSGSRGFCLMVIFASPSRSLFSSMRLLLTPLSLLNRDESPFRFHDFPVL